MLAALAFLLLTSACSDSDRSTVSNETAGFSVGVPRGWQKQTKGFVGPDSIAFVYPDNQAKRCKLSIRLNKLAANSTKAKIIEDAKTVEAMVQNPEYDRASFVLPKHRATFSPVEVDGIPAMRGVLEGGVSGKKWVGELVVGFADLHWLRIKAYPLDSNDPDGHDLCAAALDEVIKTLERDR